MNNNIIKRIAQKKTGKTWADTYIDNDAASVYKSLSHDLIAKKLNACTYIKSIKRVQNYDGTNTIIVLYDNNTRSVYTIDNVW